MEGEHSLLKLPGVFRGFPLQEQLQAQSREAVCRLVDLVKNKEESVFLPDNVFRIKPCVMNHMSSAQTVQFNEDFTCQAIIE